jgi:uncharacterized cupin superfamily protein
MDIEKVNVFDSEFAGRLDVSGAVGSNAMSMYVYDLDPGRSSSPYHYEYEEEWLLVLDGTLVLRAPDGEHTLERGDIVCFAAGPAGAHKVMNRSEGTARIMMFSSARTPAVTVYPDSDKVGVWPADDVDGLVFRRGEAVPYSDGEEGWESAV